MTDTMPRRGDTVRAQLLTGTVQIDTERLVSDPHHTATQLDRFPVFAHHQIVVLKALGWLYGLQLERIRSR